ncbi:hypothetical protein SBP28_004484 [Candidozyma auris]
MRNDKVSNEAAKEQRMFGQIVIGPPGSGKSTFCHGMYQFLSALGRKSCIVNLDPANEHQAYPSCALDIRDTISIDQVMTKHGLGPNGALVHSFESMYENTLKAFAKAIEDLSSSGNYLIFDCPGQVELFTHEKSFHRIFDVLTSKYDARLCVVSLVDSVYLTNATQYISITLLTLRSMLQLGLPQVNVISKIDKLKEYGTLPMPLDYYSAAEDLQCLDQQIQEESSGKLGKNLVKLTKLVGHVVEDFGIVKYEVLSVEDKRSMMNLLEKIDRANGYIFGTNELSGDSLWRQAVFNGQSFQDDNVTLQERWIDQKSYFDDVQRTENKDLHSTL